MVMLGIFSLMVAIPYLLFHTHHSPFIEGFTVPSGPGSGGDFHILYNWAVAARIDIEAYLKLDVNYSPFTVLMVVPLSFLSFNQAYLIVSLLTLTCLFFGIYAALSLTNDNGKTSTRLAISGLFTAVLLHTYPVMFEIERGNCNIIAAGTAVFALALLRRKSYFSSTIAILLATQVKLYPAALLGLFLWRTRFRYLILFSALNLVCFFALGFESLKRFLYVLTAFNGSPYVWMGNQSIYSWIMQNTQMAESSKLDLIRNWQLCIVIIYLIAVCVGLFITYLQMSKKGWPFATGPFSLTEVSLIGIAFSLMSLLPNVSHDYKLAIHVFPMIMTLPFLKPKNTGRLRDILFLALGLVLLSITSIILMPRGEFWSKTPYILLSAAIYLLLPFLDCSISQKLKVKATHQNPEGMVALL